MSLPKPEPGLVIRYSYLWLHEHREGREDGIKDRPCAIILATHNHEGQTGVLVVPITHSQPINLAEALELPPPLKRHLGLDAERSWVVFNESNLLTGRAPICAASEIGRITQSPTVSCRRGSSLNCAGGLSR